MRWTDASVVEGRRTRGRRRVRRVERRAKMGEIMVDCHVPNLIPLKLELEPRLFARRAT